MSAYSLTAVILMGIALPLLMMGTYRKQKALIIASGTLAAVAILTTLAGLTVGE